MTALKGINVYYKMLTMRRLLATAILSVTSFCGAASAQVPECRAVSAETCALAKSLGRGINFGNMLEAPREGDWGLKVEPRYMDLAAQRFKTVRLPVRWTNHAAATADATLEPQFAARVDQVVDALLQRGLYVILDLHHYNQLFGDGLLPNEFPVDPAVLETRLINIWKQLGQRYKDRSPMLLFELLNEPHSKLDGEPWNNLLPKLLAAVRESNPSRAVLVGPSYWNHPRDLARLRLPADRNLIVAIHDYDPFPFTHQGIRWLPYANTKAACCSPEQRRELASSLDVAVGWSRSTGYPLHVGEFGSYVAADMGSRVEYTRYARDQFEMRGLGWAYWELASSFGIYDPKTGQWIEPLRAALLD